MLEHLTGAIAEELFRQARLRDGSVAIDGSRAHLNGVFDLQRVAASLLSAMREAAARRQTEIERMPGFQRGWTSALDASRLEAVIEFIDAACEEP